MTPDIAPPIFSRSLHSGGISKLSMAALMQSNNDPPSTSNPLSGPSDSVISSHPEPVFFLKHPNPESNLSSIASAGLHVSRSRDPVPQMTTARTPAPVDRPLEVHEHDPQQRSSQVAREALGASEKPHTGPMNGTTVHMPPDHIPVDPQTTSTSVADDFGPPENNPPPSLVNASTVASPGPIDESTSQDGDRSQHRDDHDIPHEGASKAFSYPMPTSGTGDPRRGLSLPNTGYHRTSLRSPSTKKHQCPYCATEFTRHHNLKSHLLTHSQEKPYLCQTCQSRFRRLHDLKRHTKLHTGERPHICPKCGRRFARGDALARHNKGQGGCAGRRASMGSFVAEDDYGDGTAPANADDAMDGLVYAEPERMDEDDERRLSIPSFKRHDVPPGHIHRSNLTSTAATTTFQPRHMNTYPPIAAGRPSGSSLFPPAAGHGASSSSTSPISQSGNLTYPPPGQPSGASVFPPSNVTESPKPLSPNALSSQQLGHGHGPESSLQLPRAHSPGMAQPYQQQPFGRTGTATVPSQTSVTNHGPSLGLPPPQPGPPQLPPTPGMSSSDSRFGLHSQAPVQPPASGPANQPTSHSLSRSHAVPAPSKTETAQNNANYFLNPHDPNLTDHSREDRLWAYIQSVHDEMAGLKTEVAALRAQIACSNVSSIVTNANTIHSETGQR